MEFIITLPFVFAGIVVFCFMEWEKFRENIANWWALYLAIIIFGIIVLYQYNNSCLSENTFIAGATIIGIIYSAIYNKISLENSNKSHKETLEATNKIHRDNLEFQKRIALRKERMEFLEDFEKMFFSYRSNFFQWGSTSHIMKSLLHYFQTLRGYYLSEWTEKELNELLSLDKKRGEWGYLETNFCVGERNSLDYNKAEMLSLNFQYIKDEFEKFLTTLQDWEDFYTKFGKLYLTLYQIENLPFSNDNLFNDRQHYITNGTKDILKQLFRQYNYKGVRKFDNLEQKSEFLKYINDCIRKLNDLYKELNDKYNNDPVDYINKAFDECLENITNSIKEQSKLE
jgi:hypothetical protein